MDRLLEAAKSPETVEAVSGAVVAGVALNVARQVWANIVPASGAKWFVVADLALFAGALALKETALGQRYPTAAVVAVAVTGTAVVDAILNLLGFDLL